MASTSPTGIYQPEGGDAAGLAGIWKSQNDSLDQITTPQFPTTAARDAAVTAITGRAGSPPPFRACYVTGIGYMYWDLTLWRPLSRAGFGAIGAARTSPDTNLPTQAWTLLGMATNQYSEGEGMTLGASGITVQVSGRFQVSGNVLFQGNSAGRRRGIGIDSAGTFAGQSPTGVQDVRPPADVLGFTASVSGEISASAGSLIGLYAFQDSGVVLLAQSRSLTVRRVA